MINELLSNVKINLYDPILKVDLWTVSFVLNRLSGSVNKMSQLYSAVFAFELHFVKFTVFSSNVNWVHKTVVAALAIKSLLLLDDVDIFT